MDMKTLLKGYKTGKLQSAGNMQILPILSDVEWTNVGEFDDIYIKADPEYGRMEMASSSKEITILPYGMAFITSEHVQDRSIPKTHLIKNSKMCNSYCIQDSQCGHYQDQRKRDIRFLPKQLRHIAWMKKNTGFNTIWGEISKYNQEAGLNNQAFMVNFFSSFDQQLKDFVAQFEAVEKQVGAFVFINNELVGIELVPNYKLWGQLWRPLIRDCYGSDCLKMINSGKISKDGLSFIDINRVNDIESLEAETDALLETIKNNTVDVAKSVMDITFDLIKSDNIDDYNLYNLTECSIQGDLVQHGSHTIYLSLLAKEGVERKSRPSLSKARWEGTDRDPYKDSQQFSF